MNADDAVRIVLTTAPDADAAEKLARALVEERLAACATRLPGATSIYRFEGAVHRDAEEVLLLKTTAARVDALQARLLELHPYEVPECLVLPVLGGAAPYLAWVAAETKPPPAG
ncbi:MAG TPA: divalent-cation tolerance protein CutA [Planctomycetota bacterium]|nr:divalent-cation tolerance protein CutA [Planctomycetota bacterium]